MRGAFMKNFKNFVFGTVFGVTLTVSSIGVSAKAKEFVLTQFDKNITVNGEAYKDNTLPILSYNNTTYVPLRAFSNMVGSSIDYDANTNTVVVGGNSSSTVDNNDVVDNINNNTNEPVAYTENGIDYLEINGIQYIKALSISFPDSSYTWWYDSNVIGVKKDGELIINNIPFIRNDNMMLYIDYDYYLNNINH